MSDAIPVSTTRLERLLDVVERRIRQAGGPDQEPELADAWLDVHSDVARAKARHRLEQPTRTPVPEEETPRA